jgi:hypothetical protein
MTLEMIKELFGIMHVGEEEVSLSQPITAVVVPPEGTGCLVTVDDKGPIDEGTLPPLVSSSPFFFSQEHRRFFLPFFLINVIEF